MTLSICDPVLTANSLMEQLGVSRASVHRDLGRLDNAGRLERVADTGSVPGRRAVERDREIEVGKVGVLSSTIPLDSTSFRTARQRIGTG